MISVDQIVNKDLFAKKTVSVLDSTGAVVYTVYRGERVGTVFSYLEREGSIYWILADGNRVKHEQGLFDLEAIQQQGGKRTEDIIKEKEDQLKPWNVKLYETIAEPFLANNKLVQYSTATVIIAVVVFVLIKLYKTSNLDLNPKTLLHYGQA